MLRNKINSVSEFTGDRGYFEWYASDGALLIELGHESDPINIKTISITQMPMDDPSQYAQFEAHILTHDELATAYSAGTYPADSKCTGEAGPIGGDLLCDRTGNWAVIKLAEDSG